MAAANSRSKWDRGLSPLLLIFALSFVSFVSCNSGSSGSGASAPPSFSEVTLSAGFDYSHGYWVVTNDLVLMAGGVAAGDYDGDGWIDLYVVRGEVGGNLLFRNNGDGTFDEVGAAAGVNLWSKKGSGPVFADFTGDGALDLFVGGVDTTVPTLFANNGDGTFTDVTVASGVQLHNLNGTFSACFGDYDGDDDLDLFLTHWGADYADGLPPQFLWQNNGDGTFVDVTVAAGVDALIVDGTLDHTFTGNFADVNNDGWPDLLVAADFGTSQILINNQDGTFTRTTTPVISDENGMGAAIGDYDNDGDLDWFVSSIYSDVANPQGFWGNSGNRFYRNLGDGSFEDVTDAVGVREGYWGWGSSFGDFNNDGRLDLFHVNGFGFPQVGGPDPAEEFLADPSRLFIATSTGSFEEQSLSWGIHDVGQGRGVVVFDYDRDGDLDLFIANNGAPPTLYRNDRLELGNFLNIRLEGVAPNTGAVGARVYLSVDGATQMREVRCGNNFVSQNPYEQHIGIGAATMVDEVRVVWPSGTSTVLNDVVANQFLVVSE